MRGKTVKPTQATGSVGDVVWRKRLLGRLNDIDTQEFAEEFGVKTEFAGMRVAVAEPTDVLSSLFGALPRRSVAVVRPDHRPIASERSLEEVSGEVIDAWSAVDARREKLVLARQSAMHLAQRSRLSLITAGVSGLVGIGAALGMGALQMISSASRDNERIADATAPMSVAEMPSHAPSEGTVVAAWADAFARSAKPVAMAAYAAHNTMPVDQRRATAAAPEQKRNTAKSTAVVALDAERASTTRPKALAAAAAEPDRLIFNVSLDGTGERTAMLPLRLTDASVEDQDNTIVVRNMPAEASLSAGIRLKSGEWALQMDELSELQIFLPAKTPSVLDLDLSVVRRSGDVVARTQISLTTEHHVASNPRGQATGASLMHVSNATVRTPDVVAARASETVKTARAPATKQKTETHAALPNSKPVADAAGETADKLRRAAATKQAQAKKVPDYSALGADFAREQRARSEQGDAKPEAAKPWLSGFAKPQPDWVPKSSNNQ